jgi:RNA polymerase sigma factor (TIGR02999 family)
MLSVLTLARLAVGLEPPSAPGAACTVRPNSACAEKSVPPLLQHALKHSAKTKNWEKGYNPEHRCQEPPRWFWLKWLFREPGRCMTRLAVIKCSHRAMRDVTRILQAAEQGDAAAPAQLLSLVYEELRRLAAHRMAQEAPGQTLQATALVHEAWVRLVGDEAPRFANRAHFFGAAAEAMRRILIESARRRRRLKRGGDLERVDLDAVQVPLPMPDDELLALDEALDALHAVNARAAEVVKLCFFVGLTQEQAAQELGLSLSTAQRLWNFARAWLFREMEKARTLPQ